MMACIAWKTLQFRSPLREEGGVDLLGRDQGPVPFQRLSARRVVRAYAASRQKALVIHNACAARKPDGPQPGAIATPETQDQREPHCASRLGRAPQHACQQELGRSRSDIPMLTGPVSPKLD